MGAFLFCSLHFSGHSCRWPAKFPSLCLLLDKHTAGRLLQQHQYCSCARALLPTSHHRRAVAPCSWFFTLLVLPPHPTSISSLQWDLPSSQCVPSCHLSCEPIGLIEVVVEKQAEIRSIIKLKQNTESLGVLCMCLSCVRKP